MTIIKAHTYAVIVTGVGEAVRQELLNTPESGGAPLKMRWCNLVAGAIAADNCKCGQFAQSIQRINPTLNFPVDSSGAVYNGGCGQRAMMVTVIATIFRCAPGLKNNGDPPSCEELLASDLTWLGDEFAMRNAVTCYLAGLKTDLVINAYSVGASVPLGPEGDCLGLELTYQFQVV